MFQLTVLLNSTISFVSKYFLVQDFQRYFEKKNSIMRLCNLIASHKMHETIPFAYDVQFFL
jgi:hypothetical protein